MSTTSITIYMEGGSEFHMIKAEKDNKQNHRGHISASHRWSWCEMSRQLSDRIVVKCMFRH